MSDEKGSVVAGIDVGTNSVKCLVARVAEGRILGKLADSRKTTRLGEGVDRDRRIAPEATRRTCEAITEMVAAARQQGASRIRAVATSAMRDASNARLLIDCVREACGVKLEVVPGEEEARLGYMAVHEIYDRKTPLATFDIGGGSTEWVMGEGPDISFRTSLDLGAVRVTDLFLHGDPPAPEDVDQARARIAQAFSQLPDAAGRKLIGIGGTLRTLAAVAQRHAGDHGDLEGFHLHADEVDRQVRHYARMSAAERAEVPGMERDRADIILGGALLVQACLEHAAAKHVTVSDRGLRYGLVLSLG